MTHNNLSLSLFLVYKDRMNSRYNLFLAIAPRYALSLFLFSVSLSHSLTLSLSLAFMHRSSLSFNWPTNTSFSSLSLTFTRTCFSTSHTIHSSIFPLSQHRFARISTHTIAFTLYWRALTHVTAMPVWPDLAKFCHFDDILEVFGNSWKFKLWTYFWQFFMLLGKSSLL